MSTKTSPQTPAAATCRIVIINDVLGTRMETYSPQSAEDALRNHGDVAQAKVYVDLLDCIRQEERNNKTIGVSIRHNDDSITIHWHITGDVENAEVAWQDVIDSVGDWT